MFIGTLLFVITLLLIAPQSRLFLSTSLANAATFMHDWAPLSYALLVLLLIATIGAVYAMKSWPKTVVPENPMAKYNREDPVDD